jgi:hypothetical protein
MNRMSCGALYTVYSKKVVSNLVELRGIDVGHKAVQIFAGTQELKISENGEEESVSREPDVGFPGPGGNEKIGIRRQK